MSVSNAAVTRSPNSEAAAQMSSKSSPNPATSSVSEFKSESTWEESQSRHREGDSSDIKRVVILGARGRDFFMLQTLFRRDAGVRVIGIVDCSGLPQESGAKVFPVHRDLDEKDGPCLRYCDGVNILPYDEYERLLYEEQVDEVVLAYSDINATTLAAEAALALGAGASFKICGSSEYCLSAELPVIAIVATLTGSGKSQTSRFVAELLEQEGVKPVVIHHPMVYGKYLDKQRVQRFSSLDDLGKHDCTVEECEEFLPHLEAGQVVYSGYDLAGILGSIEVVDNDAQIIIWDGAHNDQSFLSADMTVCITDATRNCEEFVHGLANLRAADCIIINKVDTAHMTQVANAHQLARQLNPEAEIIEAASPVEFVDEKDEVKLVGKRCLCIEDAPSLTQGGAQIGAASLMVLKMGGGTTLINPAPFLCGSLKELAEDMGDDMPRMIPAMGYTRYQLDDLQATIENAKENDAFDVLVIGTPCDFVDSSDSLDFKGIDVVRVKYSFQEIGLAQRFSKVLRKFIDSDRCNFAPDTESVPAQTD